MKKIDRLLKDKDYIMFAVKEDSYALMYASD